MGALEPAEIYYRIHTSPQGEQLPVVLLHGLMGFAGNWGKVTPKLSEDRPVLVLDQRGHGKTKQREHGYAPDDYAADLKNLVDHLGWPRLHVVGHSMGGRVALAFCKNYPQYARTLCLEDSGLESNPGRVDWIEGLLGGIPTPFPSKDAAKLFFAQKYPPGSMLGGFLFANLQESTDGKMDWRFYKPGMIETIQQGRALDAMDDMRRLNIPTLLVRGGNSEEFSQPEAERMKQAREGTELITIAGAGHFVHAEKPQEFTAALRDFLLRNDS